MEKRLGSSSEGARSVKEHEWFERIDWMTVPLRAMKPFFVPAVEPWEATMFDTVGYPDSTESVKRPEDAERLALGDELSVFSAF